MERLEEKIHARIDVERIPENLVVGFVYTLAGIVSAINIALDIPETAYYATKTVLRDCFSDLVRDYKRIKINLRD